MCSQPRIPSGRDEEAQYAPCPDHTEVVWYLAAIFALLWAMPASAQRIEITSLPAYGKQGLIRGRVMQADPSRVSVVIFSRTKGFSIQPSCKQTTVQPDATGFFSARIADETAATHYAALLVPRDFVP